MLWAMSPHSPSPFAALAQFLRTPTLGRSIVLLLTAAIVLLLLVNLTTFLMIRRTAAFNDDVGRSFEVRLLARDVLVLSVNAETGQRGFLLTGRPEYLTIKDQAIARLPATLNALREATGGDSQLDAGVAAVERLSRDRNLVIERTITLARQGRIGEAVQVVRSGEGKILMDAMRAEIATLDAIEGRLLAQATRRSERSSTVTVAVNAVAGALILILAGIVLMLVRRYIAELNDARAAIDQVNAGLEDTIKARTGALTRANEEVQRFAYIVSHDLRSPLVNVMGYTAELEQAGRTIDAQMTKVETLAPDLVERDAVVAVREDIPEAVGFIRASTEKMDRLINAILKLSREGRRNLVPETIDMAGLVKRIADTIRHQTEAADAEIVVKDMATFESDRLSVEQIMGNLIENALKYVDHSRPGRIVVTGEDLAGGWVEYAVADNGRGISYRDHERIFELFRRSGRQDRPGEGLGLAFVRNSVRRLGGSIDVESELGKGSTFRVKFPKRLILTEAGDTL